MIDLHMNAVKVKEKQLEKLNLSDWIMEEKFKGIRVWYKKEFGNVQLITRGGEDVTWNFPHITERDWIPNFSSIQLDCELYDPSKQDEIVSGWAMTMSIDPEITKNCVLKVFDILHAQGTDLNNSDQIFRKTILDQIKLPGPLEHVLYYPADNHRKYYEHILAQKGEGIMLKNRHGIYLPGKRRVGYWLKRKRRDSYDVVIMGFTEGKGKYSDVVGAVEVGQYVAGQLRYICNVSGMDDFVRRNMKDSPHQYLGKVLTVFAMEQDKNSLALIEPSYSHIRVDKRPEECIYGREES